MTRSSSPKIVALGGGHGLSASLRALKTISDDLVAIVGVSDNGGSSGRLRAEFDVIPPGDLRMALIALCSDSEHGRMWAEVLQHRFSGHGELSGHSFGNLLITALWQKNQDIIAGLDAVCNLLEAQGRVLPLSLQPLDIEADVQDDSGKTNSAIGQVAVATAKGLITNLRFAQRNAKACPEAIAAVNSADVIVMGPGSWYTSVVNHLLLDDFSDALVYSQAKKILITNLTSQTGETETFTPAQHLEVLRKMKPELNFDLIVVDNKNVSSEFLSVANQMTKKISAADVASSHSNEIHSSTRLAEVLSQYLELPPIQESV